MFLHCDNSYTASNVVFLKMEKLMLVHYFGVALVPKIRGFYPTIAELRGDGFEN